jgi:hypothetical protein
MKHGVTREVTEFLDKVQNDPLFSNVRKNEGSKERLEELYVTEKATW